MNIVFFFCSGLSHFFTGDTVRSRGFASGETRVLHARTRLSLFFGRATTAVWEKKIRRRNVENKQKSGRAALRTVTTIITISLFATLRFPFSEFAVDDFYTVHFVTVFLEFFFLSLVLFRFRSRRPGRKNSFRTGTDGARSDVRRSDGSATPSSVETNREPPTQVLPQNSGNNTGVISHTIMTCGSCQTSVCKGSPPDRTKNGEISQTICWIPVVFFQIVLSCNSKKHTL